MIRRAAGATSPGTSLRSGLLHGVARGEASGAGGDRDALRRRLASIELAEVRPLLVWLGCLAVAVLAFQSLGRTTMASPPITQPGDWLRWADLHTADEIAFNVLRLLGVGLSWYLLGVTLIGALARVVRWGGLVRFADVLTVGPVKSVLQQTLGATLAITAVAAVPGTALTASAGPAIASAPVSVAAATTTQESPASLVAEDSLRVGTPSPHDGWERLLGGNGALADVLPSDIAGDSVKEKTEAVEAEVATHVVAPGDHFWRLAEEIVGHGANEDDVTSYWNRLIEANRTRLVDPSNPDLLLPGQVIVLPGAAA